MTHFTLCKSTLLNARRCAGYYLTMYEKVFHSVRRPLGGTGCSFYPTFPAPDDLQVRPKH